MASKTRADLLDQVEDLRAERDRLAAQLDALKSDVRMKAKEVAEEQGWCREGLNETLEELGLDPISTEYGVQVTVRLYFTVDISEADESGSIEVDEEWVRRQVNQHLNHEHTAVYCGGEWMFEDEDILHVAISEV